MITFNCQLKNCVIRIFSFICTFILLIFLIFSSYDSFNIYGFFSLIFFILLSMFVFFVGSKNYKLNKSYLIIFPIELFCFFIIKEKGILIQSDIIPYLYILTLVLIFIFLWMFITPYIRNIILKLCFKYNSKIIFVLISFMFLFICKGLIYIKAQFILTFFIFYPFYLLSSLCNDIELVNKKNNIFSIKTCIIVLFFFLFLISMKLNFKTTNSFLAYGVKNISGNEKVLFFAFILSLWSTSFIYAALAKEKFKLISRENNIEFLKAFSIFIDIMLFLLTIINSKFFSMKYILFIFTFLFFLFAVKILFWNKICYLTITLKDKINKIYIDVVSNVNNIISIVLYSIFAIIIIEFVVRRFNLTSLIGFLYNYTFIYNILCISFFAYLFIITFGRRIGKIFFVFFYSIIFIANIIKLKYLDSMFLPIDVLAFKEFILIADDYVNVYLVYTVISFLLIGIIYFCLKSLRNISLKKIKIHFNFIPFIIIIIFTIFQFYTVEGEVFCNNRNQISWMTNDKKVQNYGYFVELAYEIKEFKTLIPYKPYNYNKDKMLELRSSFYSLHKEDKESNIKPNVIIVLLESFFDANKLEGISYDADILQNLKQYQNAKLFSPSYAGSTSKVEFEVLTGLSNAFFKDNAIPYNVYFYSDKKVPSIVYEFKKNGYDTIAIHPNDKRFYNRDIVYNDIGFDKFYGKEVFEESDISGRFISDSALCDKIISELKNENGKSKFIFAATIENHGGYANKYKNTSTKVSSDYLSTSQKGELENYIEGVKNTDDFIGDIIDEVNNIDEPTLVYFFGDHLPKISAIDELNFADNVYNRYETPIIMYSNYKELKQIDNYITPNQLGIQALVDANIDYDIIYDYIYSLRNKYPAIHKEYDINFEDLDLKKYYLLQYDLMFGNRYILGKNSTTEAKDS